MHIVTSIEPNDVSYYKSHFAPIYTRSFHNLHYFDETTYFKSYISIIYTGQQTGYMFVLLPLPMNLDNTVILWLTKESSDCPKNLSRHYRSISIFMMYTNIFYIWPRLHLDLEALLLHHVYKASSFPKFTSHIYKPRLQTTFINLVYKPHSSNRT